MSTPSPEQHRAATLRGFIARNEARLAAEPDGAAGAVTLSYLKRDRAELASIVGTSIECNGHVGHDAANERASRPE